MKIGDIVQDIRYGLKLLLKDRSLTVVAVVSLALGIGVNTTIFSMANAFLLRPLPVEDPDRLVSLYNTLEGSSSYGSFSYPGYIDVKDRSDVFFGKGGWIECPGRPPLKEHGIHRRIGNTIIGDEKSFILVHKDLLLHRYLKKWWLL